MHKVVLKPGILIGCAFALLSTVMICSPLFAGRTVPDPCKLIGIAELEEIVGKLSKGPKPADPSSGEVSCEYTIAKDSSWLMINLHEGDFNLMRKSFGGKAPVSIPELGKEAFLNESYEDFSAELFAKKGDLTLRLSMPKGPTAGDKIKAIAKKALPRL